MPELRRYWGHATPPEDYKPLNLVVGHASGDDRAAPTSATLRMYGPVDSWGGPWGVSAEEVSMALDGLPDTVEHIQLRINSPGGEGWEGMTILNMLRAHPATVTAVVDGLAASAASFIAAGCDETVMSPGTQMMIHDAWGLAIGNPAEMRKAAEFLDSCSDSIAELYTEAAGGTRAKWRALMNEETWYTAEEAASAGLADRVDVVADTGPAVTAGRPPEQAENDDDESVFDLTVFRYEGRAQAPDPLAAQAEPTPDADAPEDDANSPESADPSADAAALAAAPAEESADEDDQTRAAHLAVIENAARFAFDG